MELLGRVDMLELPANLMAEGPNTIHPTLIWDNNTVILVDTGYPGQLQNICKEMTQLGVSFDRLDKIIITHHDMDHIGSLSALLKESTHKIEVIAHKEEKPYIQTELPPIRMTQLETLLNTLPEEKCKEVKMLYENLKASYKNFKANVDTTVTDGEKLPYCGGITVIFTPGHTKGHISLYHNQSKTLIAGDILFVDNGLLVPAPDIVTVDKNLAFESLLKLTQYDIKRVICYHGGHYNDNVNYRIAELANS